MCSLRIDYSFPHGGQKTDRLLVYHLGIDPFIQGWGYQLQLLDTALRRGFILLTALSRWY
jgi:hypothetical protein